MSKLICLDPGHNSTGADTGAEGYNLREQDITLDLVQRIKPLLEYNGFSVVTTRDSDFVKGDHSTVNASLQTRCDIANNAKVDLFCSVHINAGGGTGTEVYCYKFDGQAEIFANKMIYYLIQTCQWENRGVKEEDLYVIKYTNMPAILTENGFIDMESDANKLKNPDFRQGIAIAHAKAICDYFGVEYKNQGGNSKVKTGVLLYTKDDAVTGFRIAEKFGNCAVFVRKEDHTASPEVMNCETLYIVGGQSVGHPNEVILSGASWWETVVNAKAKLGF